jgi:hypothetical protein
MTQDDWDEKLETVRAIYFDGPKSHAIVEALFGARPGPTMPADLRLGSGISFAVAINRSIIIEADSPYQYRIEPADITDVIEWLKSVDDWRNG